jgi:hypothetical protein
MAFDLIRSNGLALAEQEFPETVRSHDFLVGLSLENQFFILDVPESQNIVETIISVILSFLYGL